MGDYSQFPKSYEEGLPIKTNTRVLHNSRKAKTMNRSMQARVTKKESLNKLAAKKVFIEQSARA